MNCRIRLENIALVTAVALVFCSCHELTEFEGSLVADVIFIRTSDHTVVGSIDGIDDGRAICSINNKTFYVLSGSGMLYKMDSEAMGIDTVFSVFSGPGSGIYDIVAPPPRSKIYIMGNGSQIVEVNIGSNTVTDVFQVGPSPSSMVTSRGPYNTMLYVGDAQDSRLREVDVTDNRVVRWIQLPITPQAIELGSHGDFVLISSRSDGANVLVNLQTPSMIYSYNPDLGYTANDIQVVTDSSSYFISCPNWGGMDGVVQVADSLGDKFGNPIPIPGHPFSLAATPNGHYLYVLSNTGDGTGLLTVMDIWFGWVEAQIPIEGYPWDVTVHRNGEYVLVLAAD